MKRIRSKYRVAEAGDGFWRPIVALGHDVAQEGREKPVARGEIVERKCAVALSQLWLSANCVRVVTLTLAETGREDALLSRELVGGVCA